MLSCEAMRHKVAVSSSSGFSVSASLSDSPYAAIMALRKLVLLRFPLLGSLPVSLALFIFPYRAIFDEVIGTSTLVAFKIGFDMGSSSFFVISLIGVPAVTEELLEFSYQHDSLLIITF